METGTVHYFLSQLKPKELYLNQISGFVPLEVYTICDLDLSIQDAIKVCEEKHLRWIKWGPWGLGLTELFKPQGALFPPLRIFQFASDMARITRSQEPSDLSFFLPESFSLSRPVRTYENIDRHWGMSITGYPVISTTLTNSILLRARSSLLLEGKSFLEWTLKNHPAYLLCAAIQDKRCFDVNYSSLKLSREQAEKIHPFLFRAIFQTALCSWGGSPNDFFENIDSLGLLEVFCPELAETKNCLQDPKWHEDTVFIHLCKTLKKLNETGVSTDLRIHLAALFHDVGKARTREIMN